jgi:anti-sigma-K factor RskA
VSQEHEPFAEDLAAYALGSLGGPEQARVEAHVASCETCATRLDEYRAVAGVLPMALDPVAPPPEAWAFVRAGARRRRTTHGSANEPFLAKWRWAPWPLATAMVAALLIWNVVLQREASFRPPGPEVEALARRPGRLVILAGTGIPGASARLLVAIDGHHGHLAIAGLRQLPRQRVYQLWFIPATAPPMTGGVFGVDASGRAWVSITVPISLDEARAIAVTEEPITGSGAPTGEYLLEARTWR